MILLAGKNQMGNVLHVIQGPESAFWNELHGSAAVDITPVLSKMDDQRPVYLHLSTCESEQDTSMHLHALMQAGAAYPFAPPSATFVPKTLIDDPDVQAPKTKPKSNKAKPDVINVCTRCLNPEAKLVPGLTPHICYSCVAIDLHIASTKKDSD
jgi:hypothetical protein